ncbi:hypothetical protein RQP46_009380 [Phenoliferia psychrophenolica]
MILLEPHLDLAAGTLTLRVPAYNEFPASEHTIPIEPTPESEEHFDLKVWASPPLDGFDVGTDALNRALSDFMGKDCRLMKKGVERREAGPDEGWIAALKPSGVDLAYEEDLPSQVGWADQFPILLTSEESLKDVENKVLTDEGVRSTPKFDHVRWSPSGPPLEINRFRGNIVVRGGKKWEEDGWGEVQIGGAADGSETLYVAARENTWARYAEKVCFGVNVVSKFSRGKLHVGDKVVVTRRFKALGEDRYERPEDADDFTF